MIGSIAAKEKSKRSKPLETRVFTHDSPNLDLLRAIAVLYVVVDHLLGSIYPVRGLGRLGHFGVLIFFVHTSLVLMLSMERMKSAEGSLSFGRFYIRRAFRIYPLSIFTVLVAAVTGFTLLPWRDLWPNLSLTMNFTVTKPAVYPLWSLPYEIDMYLFLPLLFLFAMRFRSVWATFGLMIAAGILAFFQARSGIEALDLIQYAGCFLPGIMAFQLSSHPRFRWPARLWPFVILGLTAVFMAASALHLSPEFLTRWPMCLLLGLAAPQFQQLTDGPVRRIAAGIAKYSYGIYLMHVFAIYIGLNMLDGQPLMVRILASTLALIAFPVAAYHWIEKPGIAWGKNLAARV